MLVMGFFVGYLHHPTLQAVLAMTLLSEQIVQKHQENEEEKIIHYNHSMQWIMLDMVRYIQVID